MHDGKQPNEDEADTCGHVLLVEDDFLLSELTRDILEAETFSVTVIRQGEQALEWLSKHTHVDVILTDVKLPGMNGFDFAKRARALIPLVPVVFLTGYSDDHETAALGPLLQKPVNPDILVATLKQEIENKR